MEMIEMERSLGMMNQDYLSLRRSSILKTLASGISIAFPTKIFKEVVILLRTLGVLVVGSNTLVGFFLMHMVALDVVIGVIR